MNSCAFDDRNSLAVSSSMDSSVRVWHRSSQEAAFVVRTEHECTQASFMRGSQHMLLTASRAGAQVYDLRMHRCVKPRARADRAVIG
jgi:hypothetical protein